MLSGISHDLRTPLTRIKLQLAFIKDQNIAKKLSDDVQEMEKMLNEYLQFASSTFSEKTERFDIKNLIENIIKKYENKNITSELLKDIYMNGRKNLIRRCLNNLIDNSVKYANKTNLQMTKSNSYIVLTVDDNGPGISKDEYENVFKPFYKINKSRGDSKSSVGLGLSIASDIALMRCITFLSLEDMGNLFNGKKFEIAEYLYKLKPNFLISKLKPLFTESLFPSLLKVYM